ncbi:Arabinose operon regulatory protein [compost metagenome]
MDLSSQMAGKPEISLSQRMRLQSAIFELFGQLLEAISAEVDLYADISYEKVELARQIRSRLQGLVFQQFKQAASDEEHYGIEDIAAELGISSSHCSRVFRQIYGISPRVFLSDQMLHEAKVLLDDPRMSVNEISTLLGYKDIAHFSRQFKRWCGISPSGYRKLREEDSTS